ncbi:DCL family protein [Corynebacterium nasicanis]|uniref:DCL family protein n=1 Tax=Corynebacterium nasicanis TaxID=1448267 RepID=A0ABW1Q8Z3_9CORY
MTYVVGGITFRTKNDVREHARKVLNSAVLGEELTGGEASFVGDLFRAHPNYAAKRGNGVHFFYVGVIPAWETRNFLLYRLDGTFDNFSIKKCVGNMSSD